MGHLTLASPIFVGACDPVRPCSLRRFSIGVRDASLAIRRAAGRSGRVVDLADRSGGQPDGKFLEDRIEPCPLFNLTDRRAGHDAQEDRRSVTTALTPHEERVFTEDRRKFDQTFGQVVVNIQTTVFGVTAERLP